MRNFCSCMSLCDGATWGGVGGIEGAVTGQVQVEGEVRQGEGGMRTR